MARSWRRQQMTAGMTGEVTVLGDGTDGGTIRAAVGSLYAGRTVKAAGFDQTWEEQLRIMDRDGAPAILGTLLDIEAAECAKLGLVVRRIDGEEPPQNVGELFLSMFRGINGEDTAELVNRGVRLMRRSGRFAVVFADAQGASGRGGRATIMAVSALVAKKEVNPATGSPEDGYLLGAEVKDRKAPDDAKPRWVPKNQVREVWVPDPDDPGQPWSPYARTVTSLRTLRLAGRRTTREFNAHLTGSRALWFEGSGQDLVRRVPGQTTTIAAPLAVTIENILSAQEANLNDVSETETRSAATIPVVSTKKPELISLSEPLDPNLVPLWDRVLKEFALATPWPTKWVEEGTGAGNHWTDKLAQEEGRQLVVYPVMRQFCALITAAVLRPILLAARVPDADRYVVDYQPADIDAEALTPEQAHQAWQDGLISRIAYARIMGIDEADMLKLGDGVDEWDIWTITSGAASGIAQWWERELQQQGKIPYGALTRAYRPSGGGAEGEPVAAGMGVELARSRQWWE